ncbi:cyanate permease [Sinobacterium caligoides]|uniref:Cyanate permease n=1 Tax=Sinobacterium caligoides TaxID=933926 RepID=A0A3N2DR54_9GAMM|nr:MFS transporter [Sinobacterium caligoides]ROS01775.1 cyanate permease [Sinobacterium caligoides]
MSSAKVSGLTRLCLLLGSSLLVMANAAIGPSLAELNRVFHDPFAVSLLMTLPALAVVICAPFVGRLMQLLGERATLLLGLLIYGLAGSSGLWCDSLNVLLAFRLLFGVGIALCMTVINHLIGDYFEGRARTHFLSLQGVAVNLGGIIFVTIGGALAAQHWRLPFAIYLLALLVLLLSFKGISNPRQLSLTTQSRLRLRDIRRMLPFYFLSLLGMLLYYIILIELPFTLHARLAFDSAHTGMLMGVMSVLSALVAYLFRHGLAKFGDRCLMVVCFTCFAIALLFLFLTSLLWGVYVTIAFAGVAFGLLLPTLSHLVISSCSAAQRARMVSGFVMAYFLGQALSAVVLKLQSSLPTGWLFMGLALLAVVVAAVLWLQGFGKATMITAQPLEQY